MTLKKLFEEYKKIREDISLGYPIKLTPSLARHALEFGLSQFTKVEMGPTHELAPRAVQALPPGSLLEVLGAEEPIDYYYNNGDFWFTSAGKKITADRICADLKNLPPAERFAGRVVGWKPKVRAIKEVVGPKRHRRQP